MGFTEEDAREYIKANYWKFAKTMAKIPHEYTLRERSTNEAAFEGFVTFIRENGYDEKFFSKTFTYYNVDGYKYWTMGSPLEQTILINRAKL